MIYVYKEVVDELTINNVISEDDIFDYRSDEISEIYDRYFQYCQTCLTEYSNEHDFQPAKIFFYNDYSVNAAANHIDTYYIIRVNMGMIDILYNLFYVKNEQFDQGILKDLYKNLASSFDAPLGYIMFQVATYFTFYHERAHLIQRSPLLESSLDEINFGIEVDYSSLNHSLEFDADLEAAHCIVFVILEYWKKLPVDFKNSEYANEVLSLVMASIFIKLMYFESKYSDIYYKGGTHPHPIIRITYILDVIVRVAQDNFENIKFDSLKIINSCFEISSNYCENAQRLDMVKLYREALFENYKEIENFINEVLIPESDAIPYLVKNRK